MTRIHQLIENREYPNARRLAREFDTKKNGFFFTEPVRQFPKMPMSGADVFTMFVAGSVSYRLRGQPLMSVRL